MINQQFIEPFHWMFRWLVFLADLWHTLVWPVTCILPSHPNRDTTLLSS
jgi:hypothetical protein